MPADDAMTPLERLLNLVGLLLESERPLTFEQIRETLEAYGGDNLESAKRKFERDKDVLREYGVPLVMEGTDVWDVEQGYTIRKEDYYLPEISFTPEEITALFLAAQGGTERTAVAQGVRKLLYGADGGVLLGASVGPLVVGADARADRVLTAAGAAEGRRRLRFGYRSSTGATSERVVDAFAVVYRGGHWYLVGHDLERDDIRAFRLSRCTSELEDAGEGRQPPAGFDPGTTVVAGPWTAAGDEPAIVAFTPEAAVLAASEFPGARQTGERDGRVLVSVPSVDDELLSGLLLQFGPDAEVLSPARLREAVVARLEGMLDA
jgi:proteasome accessory factor B